MSISLWWLSLILLFGGARLFAKEPTLETVHLIVGDMKVLSAPEDAELEVSKRGVLQIEEESPGKWRITALTRGFVVLSFKDQELVKRVHVFSVPRPSSARQNNLDFCVEGIRCVGDSLIEGEAPSLERWLEALGYCRSRKACLFDLRLREEAALGLEGKVERLLGDQTKVTYQAPDRLIIRQRCFEADKPKEQKKGLIAKGHWLDLMVIDYRCDGNDLDIYQMSASIALVSRDAAEQLGLDLVHQKVSLTGQKMTFDPTLVDKLTSTKMSILAQPSVQLRVGQTAKIASGGEFKVMFAEERPDHNVREGWKRYGVELQFTIREADKGLLQVATELSLSSPLGSGQDSLQMHKIASDVLLSLGKKQLVGLTDLYSRMEGEMQRSLLSGIPILGPLFTVRSKSDGQRVLMYWLTAEKLDAEKAD